MLLAVINRRANLNVLEVVPGPWSLAHCVYNTMGFPERQEREAGGAGVSERMRSSFILNLCWNLWSEMNSPRID